MADTDFPEVNAPPVEEPDYSDLFNLPGQWDNVIRGINRGADGFQQALTEAKEALGFVPAGTSEFVTQEMKQEQKILREATADDAQLTGASGFEIAGEALPLFVAPLGSTVPRAVALGAGVGSGFFQEDVSQSRLDDIAISAASGGLFRALLRGGKARGDAEKGVEQAEQLLLTGPARRPQQLALPPTQQQLALPPPRPKARDPRASLRDQGFTADDFQRAGRDVIPGLEGVPKPRVRQQLTPVQKALSVASKQQKKPSAQAAKALRKAEVFARNAARKADKMREVVNKVKKPHLRLKAQKQLTKALEDKVAANVLVKSIRDVQSGARKLVGKQFPQKPSIRGPAAALGRQGGAIDRDLLNTAGGAVIGGTAGLAASEGDPVAGLAGAVGGGAALRALGRQAKVASANRQVDQLFDDQAQFFRNQAGPTPAQKVEQMFEDQAAFNRARSKEGGFADSDLVNTLGGAAIGSTVGLAASGGDPVAGLAGLVGGGALARAAGRRLDKVTTNKQREGMRKASEEGGNLNEEISRAQKAKDLTQETLSKVFGGGRKVMDEFMGSTMTRLQNLSPRVASALAESEFRQHFVAGQWLNQGDALFARITAAGLTDAQRETYKIALLNSTKQAKAYLNSIGKTDAANAIEEFDNLLKDVGEYLGTVGLGKNLRKNYFPRMVTDISQFEKIEEVNTYLNQLARKKGVKLTDFEKELAVSQVINGALTRGPDQAHFGRASANLQKRTVKVTRENANAYADPHQGFNDYIDSITTQVERRQFFQSQNVKVDDLGPNAENIESVAQRLAKQLKKGELTPDQVDEVAQLIRMRFGPGEQAPSKAVQNFKNLTYAGLLGNPIAAATQFGDLALSAHRNGIRNTAAAVVDQIARRGKLRDLDKEALLGIRNAASDFASKTATRDVLNWSLKFSGFQAVDRLGKNTFIQASMRKNQAMAKPDFVEKWRPFFDPDAAPGGQAPRTEELYQQVQRFDGLNDSNKENLGFMLWNELSDVQPIALSALPERYLRHPDGRMAYMLQSFTLKLFDVMRKDIYQNARAGNYREAAKNAARLSTLFVTMNSGVDEFKNFMLNKDSTLSETAANNYLKLLGVNKFTIDQASREGLGSAVLKTLAPPTAVIDALVDPQKALQLAPPVGRIIDSRIE